MTEMFHARIRAMQRIPGVCPGLLVRGVQWAIRKNQRDILTFVDWQGDDRCFWWGIAAAGQKFTAVANPTTGYVITVIAGWVQLPAAEKRRASA